MIIADTGLHTFGWFKRIPNLTSRLGNTFLFRRSVVNGEAFKGSATVFKPDQKANSLAKNMFPIICVCVVNDLFVEAQTEWEGALSNVSFCSQFQGGHPEPAGVPSLPQL